MLRYKIATAKDYNNLVLLWERSIQETHHFLSPKDRISIKNDLPIYFSQINMQLWFKNDVLVGFSGCDGAHLEMLFIDPLYINQGIGTLIISALISSKAILSVDVNEQNESAKMFYFKNGFVVSSRKAVDNQNRPYPLLHLTRDKAG